MLTREKLEDFVLFLQKNAWEVFGTQKKDGALEISLIKNPGDLKLEKGVPFYSFKRFFVPEEEKLFDYKGLNLKTDLTPPKNKAILGMNLLDLKSILLYDQVFEKDPYYQARRRKILIVGHSITPSIEDNFLNN